MSWTRSARLAIKTIGEKRATLFENGTQLSLSRAEAGATREELLDR
jgi:hypothetical protein